MLDKNSPFEEALERQQRIYDRIEQCCYPPVLDTISTTLSQVSIAANSISIANTLQPIMRTLSDFALKIPKLEFEPLTSAAKQLSELYSPYFFTDSLQKTLEQYQHQISEVICSISTPALSSLAYNAIDFSEVEILSDMSIKYGETVLSKEEVAQEFELQIEELKQKPRSLYDKFEDVKKKFWLVLLILNLIMFIPQIPETCEFYTDIVAQTKALFLNETELCWIIKEQAYLRETANSKANVICTLSYDTELEIVSEMPRWLEVKYTDKSGDEYTGWISKISVEKD